MDDTTDTEHDSRILLTSLCQCPAQGALPTVTQCRHLHNLTATAS